MQRVESGEWRVRSKELGVKKLPFEGSCRGFGHDLRVGKLPNTHRNPA